MYYLVNGRTNATGRGGCFVVLVMLPGGGGGTWVSFCWVCAAGLSEPLPHDSHILWPIIDPILVTFG